MKYPISVTRTTICTALAVLLVLVPATPGGFLYGQDMERGFTVAEGDWVILDVERAHISVTSWERTEVTFSAKRAEHLAFALSQENGTITIHGRDECTEENGAVIISGRDNVVIINGRIVSPDSPDSPNGQCLLPPLAEIAINVPQRQNLNLSTSGGNIKIDRLQGEFTARTSGGDVEADDIDGSADVRTSGGGIRLQHASGSVAARTSGGSVHLGSVVGVIESRTSGGSIRIGEAGAAVEARTSGGSIEVASASGAVHARTSGGSVEVGLAGQPRADSELRTSGGNVTVFLRDDLRLDLSASTSGGRISSDFPDLASQNSAGRASLAYSLNGGGPDLNLQTSAGSIRIRRFDD